MRKETVTKKYGRKRAWRSVVTTLAAVVVFVTTYALIIPAITWEKTLICEIEEHVHTDNCYSSKGELKCGKQEHTHTDECFDAPKAAEPIYICRETEHTHTEDCYFSDGTLKCTLHEHVHTENCLFENRVILAPKLAVPGGSAPMYFYDADPVTSNLKAQFTTDVSTGIDNDGKVLVDKSVVTAGDDQFDVILSALGQSYVQTIPLEDMIHPDVVMVVDISTSMNNAVSGISRLAAVTDALNNAIARLLESDPQTRIGIVAYSTYAWDGYRDAAGAFYPDGSGEKHFYLPLANYEYKEEGFEYVTIDRRGSGSGSSTHISFNEQWNEIVFTEDGSETSADGAKYNIGPAVDPMTTTTLSGTYTQDGLLGGVRMFESISAEEKAKREPVMILITDGEPNRYSEREVYHSVEEEAKISSSSGHCGYWTVRSAMYAKRTVDQMYKDAGNDHGIMFDTMGPGITSLYGQTIINPSAELLEQCRASTDSKAHGLYVDLVENPDLKLSPEDILYADFADYSIAGNLTPQEIQDGMDVIIASVRNIPRPIITRTMTEHFSIIDTDSLITFVDRLGENTELGDKPTVSYGTQSFTGVVRETGVLEQSDEYTSDFYGCPYTLYRFSGNVVEVSTGRALNMADILLYEITEKDGSKVIMWQFPDYLLPINYHNPGLKAEDFSDDTIVLSEPLQLHLPVSPKGGRAEPGETYYSNSTTEPATCVFSIADDNPYYNTKSDTEPPVYTPKDVMVTTAKSENVTETFTNSSHYDQNDLSMYVELGNNGKLETPLNLNVHKTWQDSETSHDSISISLYANGEDTGKSVTLSDDNEWMGSFENLVKYDASGKLIVYTMKENSVPDGYTVTGETDGPGWTEYTTGELIVEPAHWKTVTSIQAGKTYRIYLGSDTATANVLAVNGSNIVSKAPANNITTASEKWTVVNDGGDLYLQPSGSKNYLAFNGSSLTFQGKVKDSARISLGSDNRLQLQMGKKDIVTKYLTSAPGAANAQASGAVLTFAVPVEENIIDTRETEILYGFEITNKPIELTVSAEKIWGNGTDGLETEVSLIVYQEANGAITAVDTIVLNEDNDWMYTYTKAPVTAADVYYLAESNPGDFIVSYSGGDVKNITVGGNTFPAVQLDVQHMANVTVTNSVVTDSGVILPATGGFGAFTIYEIGALIVMGVLIIYCVLLRKRKSQQVF